MRNHENDDEAKSFGFFATKMSFWGLLSEQIDKILIGLSIGPTQLAVYTIVSFFGIRTKDIIRSLASMLVPKMTLENTSFLDLVRIHKKSIFAVLLVSCVGRVFFIYLFLL